MKLAFVSLSLAATLVAFGNPIASAQEPVVASPPAIPAPDSVPLFSEKERAALVAYWNAPGRYTQSAPPEAATTGPWQVRLTPEGSTWLLGYQRATSGNSKTPPTRDSRATGSYSAWDAWISARVSYDQAVAKQAADSANVQVMRVSAFPSTAPNQNSTANGALAPLLTPNAAATPTPLPLAPGVAPADMIAALGNPPPFASIVAPVQYQVKFDSPSDIFTYQDNVKLRDRYAYYRFPRGVVSYGTRLKDMSQTERDDLFRAAGFNSSEQKIFTQVSGLEGGFETVQTYDTGYVSIGFIQFVTLADGRADLSEVLLSEKASRPDEYRDDFRRFGIDVRPDRTLVVIDPSTGAELFGNAAVLKIIDDKRLTAVFQRAGRRPAFRVAQIKTARSYYWPSGDALSVGLPDGTAVVGTVGDVVKSEAGLATLLDRKINTGNIRVLPAVVARVMSAHNARTLQDAGLYEREIIAALKYRADFLADASLGQPSPPPAPIAAAPLPTLSSLILGGKTATPMAPKPTAIKPKTVPSAVPSATPTAPPSPPATPTPTPVTSPAPTANPATPTPGSSTPTPTPASKP